MLLVVRHLNIEKAVFRITLDKSIKYHLGLLSI